MAASLNDISTAPKDGTEIVGFAGDDGPWIIFWRAFPPGSYTDGAWQIKQLPGRDPIRNLEATHWLPIGNDAQAI